MKNRIMYLEHKAGALTGEARIGRVTFSKSGRTIYYKNQAFRRIVGGGFKANYRDQASGDDYWISGPKRRGGDRMYGSSSPIAIDEDVRVEYWRDIRGQAERILDAVAEPTRMSKTPFTALTPLQNRTRRPAEKMFAFG